MSFGPLQFRTELTAEGLKGRWALLYIVPVVGLFILFAAFAAIGLTGRPEAGAGPLSGIVIGAILILYVGFPLATLHWYAKFYRNAADALSLGDLEFGFDATTWDWLKLFLGNIGLAIITLGLGIAFWGYRSWAFMVRHIHLYGEVDASKLTQWTTHAPTEAEGFADAFDIGAI